MMMTQRIFLIAALVGLPGITAPIDFTTGISTGAHVSSGINNPQQWTDGAAFDFPIADFLQNKTYSAQVVLTGSTDSSESYVEFNFEKAAGFSSALADGRGALEVGVERNRYSIGLNAAVSRWYTVIKNNTDEEIGFDFYFVIPESLVEITGVITPYIAASGRVEATIDYLLKTPDAGSYVETNDQIFRYYFALFNDELPHGRVVKTDNVTATNLSSGFHHSYKLAEYTGVAELPMIPGRGELTVYYDMYAQFYNNSEHLGKAFLGDPLQLVGGAGGSFVPRSDDAVPEPATLLLCGAAILGLPVLRRLRRKSGDLALSCSNRTSNKSSPVSTHEQKRS